jgi:hypothetical protein
MLERTDALTNEVLESITSVLTHPTPYLYKHIIFQNPVPTSQETQYFSTTKTNHMMFRETVCHDEHLNTLRTDSTREGR